MGKRRHGQSWWLEKTNGVINWVAVVTLVVVLGVTFVGIGALMKREPVEAAGAVYTPPPMAAPSATPAPTPTPTASVPVEIPRRADGSIGAVFLGDSLTYGLFASSEEAGYRPQVVSALGTLGPVEATRGGQTGNTVQTVSESSTIPSDTGVVVLALGTNDVWNTPKEDFNAQYTALVQKVRDSAPSAVLVCLGVWSNVDGGRNYDPGIQRPCEFNGGTFVSIDDLFDTEGTRGPKGVQAFGGVSDDFHPNDTGYAAIAQRVKEALGLA